MRFRRKERGTRVKDRGKSGEVKADSPLPRYLLHIVLTCIRQESENKWYRNTVKDLLLPNTVNQKDEKPYTARLDDTAIPHIKIKITEIPLEKKLNIGNPHVPSFQKGIAKICGRRAHWSI